MSYCELSKYLSKDVKIINNKEPKTHQENLIDIPESIKKRKKIFNIISIVINTIIAIIGFIGIINYYNGLEGCFDNEQICAHLFSPQFVLRLFIEITTSSATFFFVFILVFLKIISIKHFLYLIPCYAFFFISDTGVWFDHHGFFNFLAFSAETLILFLIVLFYLIPIKLLRNVKFNIGGILFIQCVIITLSVIIYYFSNRDCNEFYKGLGGYYASDTEEYDSCTMMRPKLCYLKKFTGMADFNRLLNFDKCPNDDKTRFLKYITDEKIRNSHRVAYPNDKFQYEKDFRTNLEYCTLMQENFVDLETNPNYEHEFEVNFDKNNIGKIKLNFKRNETLVKEREAIRNNNNSNKQLFKNFLIIYIDSISRQHFLRKMPKTCKFLEKYLYSKNNDSPFNTYQFLKFNGVGTVTSPNNFPMWLGTSFENKTGYNIEKYFKDMGYITGFIYDDCSKDTLYLTYKDPSETNPNLFIEDTDHYGATLTCDTTFMDKNNRADFFRGPWNVLRRCLYGKEIHEYEFEYLDRFWEAYIDQPKFFKLAFQNGHEMSMEAIGVFDEPLANYLESFRSRGYFDDTFTILISDHGNSMNVYYRLFFEDHRVENILPTLFVFMPNKSDYVDSTELNKIKENMFFNYNRWVTPYDIYSTVVHIAFYFNEEQRKKYDKPDLGDTLLNKVIRKERTCDYYAEYRSNDFLCRCR